MNSITLKSLFGWILVSFAVFGGIIIFIKGLGFNLLFRFDAIVGDWTINVPIFFGLSGIAGAYLLAKHKNDE
ncbi:MAG: hypothetical protein ACKVTZ_19170 [Bacteroidia bacterium]